jgi:hypothetical protein
MSTHHVEAITASGRNSAGQRRTFPLLVHPIEDNTRGRAMKHIGSRAQVMVFALSAMFSMAAWSTEPPPLDAATRVSVVNAAADALTKRYVHPDVGTRAAKAIQSALAAGSYDQITERHAFADRLTADIGAIAKDKHLRVNTPGPAPVTAGAQPPPRAEGGVVRADRLPGNVGYVEVSGFPPIEAFKAPIDRAMAALADTRALIIDVRRNGGGTPVSETYLASYFLDPAKPVTVSRIVWRNPESETFRTEDFQGSRTPIQYAGKPVIVLTSQNTFSGGEALPYEMQVLKLVKVVGEVTGGGANPGGLVPLGPGFNMFVPSGRNENAITKTSWEGVGVKPDVVISAGDALKVALAQLGQTTDKTSIDALSEARLFEPRSTPKPGSEAAIRRTIAELVSGEPNYDLMSPGMQAVTRQQLPRLQELMRSMGALQSVTFTSVDLQGGDTFDVVFAAGAVIFSIALDEQGRTVMAAFRQAGPR